MGRRSIVANRLGDRNLRIRVARPARRWRAVCAGDRRCGASGL